MNTTMGNNIYSPFYAAFTRATTMGCNLTKKELVEEFTEGRTTSLKELSHGELIELIKMVNRLCGNGEIKKRTHDEIKKNNMRRAIISQFKFIGKTTRDAIVWAEKYGCKGVKRKFNEYTEQELYVLIRNAEQMKEDFLKGLRK